MEFSEFVTLAAQFLVEEDAEEMQNELKEAFRLYDKEGRNLSAKARGKFLLHYRKLTAYVLFLPQHFMSVYLKKIIITIITGNGYITTSVLREILHELDDKLTPDDLDGIIAEIDEDGSGTIDFDGKTEFQAFLKWLF